MQVKALRYFVLQGILNVDTDPPNLLQVTDLQNLPNNQKEIQIYMIGFAHKLLLRKLKVQFAKTSLKKTRIHQKEHEW